MSSPRRAERLLFWVWLAALLWHAATAGLNLLSGLVFERFGVDRMMALFRVEAGLTVLVEVCVTGAILFLALAYRSRPRAIAATVAALLAGLALATGLVDGWRIAFAPSGRGDLIWTVFDSLGLVFAVGGDISLWRAVAPDELPAWMWPAFLVCRVMSALRAALFYWLPQEPRAALLKSAAGPVLIWFSFALFLASAVLLLVVLRRAGWSAAAGPEAGALPTPGSGAVRDLIVGGAFLLGGIGVTAASYAVAAGGGRYIVATGAIAYGLFRVIRGLGRASQSGRATPPP